MSKNILHVQKVHLTISITDSGLYLCFVDACQWCVEAGQHLPHPAPLWSRSRSYEQGE